MAYTIRTISLNSYSKNFESFERADAYQSLVETCFAAVAINRSRTLAGVPHDDFDIAVIYKKSTENEDQVTW